MRGLPTPDVRSTNRLCGILGEHEHKCGPLLQVLHAFRRSVHSIQAPRMTCFLSGCWTWVYLSCWVVVYHIKNKTTNIVIELYRENQIVMWFLIFPTKNKRQSQGNSIDSHRYFCTHPWFLETLMFAYYGL